MEESLHAVGGGCAMGPDFDRAIEVVRHEKKTIRVSRLQRHMRYTYNQACRMMDTLERAGVVSHPDEYGVRDILGAGATK